MFPEIHSTVNEVEKTAAAEKIKFRRVWRRDGEAERRKPGEADRGAPHTVSSAAGDSASAGAPAPRGPRLALGSDPETRQASGSLQQGRVGAHAAGWRG